MLTFSNQAYEIGEYFGEPTMSIENEIHDAFAWKGNVLVHKKTGKRVKRPRMGFVAFKGRLWKASYVIGVLLQEKVDGRVSTSMEMARNFPDLKISKKEAVGMNLTIYRTGRACKYGHASWRYVSNGACLQCCGKLPNHAPYTQTTPICE